MCSAYSRNLIAYIPLNGTCMRLHMYRQAPNSFPVVLFRICHFFVGGKGIGWQKMWVGRKLGSAPHADHAQPCARAGDAACMLLSLTASSKHVHFNLHTYSMHAHARPATAKVRDVFTHPSCPCWSVQSKPGGGALQAVQACQWCGAPAGASVPPLSPLPPGSIGLVRPLRGHGNWFRSGKSWVGNNSG